jgi:Reverse transcriptase (RNA-dependent DNA polymerase).
MNLTKNHCLFVDFRKAYDSIVKGEVWKEMNCQNIPKKLINLIKACMTTAHCKVRVNGQLSDTFEVRTSQA